MINQAPMYNEVKLEQSWRDTQAKTLPEANQDGLRRQMICTRLIVSLPPDEIEQREGKYIANKFLGGRISPELPRDFWKRAR
jgi:hypothetical protein